MLTEEEEYRSLRAFIFTRTPSQFSRREQFYKWILRSDATHQRDFMGPRTDTVLLRLFNDRTLFSDDDMNYFFKRALDDKNMKIIRLLYLNGFDAHEARFDNGKSAVHYLAKVDEPGDRYKVNNEVTLKMIKFFLSNAYKIHCDDLGYTYLHAACMVGDVTTVRWFAIRGVNVNLNVYKHSPLHIAAQYRNEDIVRALLKSGANPNLRDHERSTALHALTWVRLCRCVRRDNFCSRRKPVDKIVEALVEGGADIEARNNHGDTPLQLAVSRFDVELTRSLLEHGASTKNLNEDRMFSGEFEPCELKNYPVTLNIIEVVQLLKSADYDMSLRARLMMLKLWMKVRGKDADHWLADYSDGEEELRSLIMLMKISCIHKIYKIPQAPDSRLYLRQKYLKLQSIVSKSVDCFLFCYQRDSSWDLQMKQFKSIMVKDDVSLYDLCQMKHDAARSIFRKKKNWSAPEMPFSMSGPLTIVVKRHIANVLIRLYFELFAANLFMHDHCKLNLPYDACRKIVEYMSDKDLIGFLKETDENSLDSSATDQTLASLRQALPEV